MDLPEHTRTKGVSNMLVLSRKQSQSIVINGDIRITVVSIRGNQVRIGIEAPARWPSSARSLRAVPREQ